MLSKVRTIALAAGMAALLGSCVGAGGDNRPSPAPRGNGSGQTVSDVPVKIGAPYQVGGVTYTPADTLRYDEVGYASWYGEEAQGNSTSNGEAFNPAGISAAHPTLPLPSYVEVTALDSGRTIVVRVNDRGPFSKDRLIDLSRGAAEQLGITGNGSVPVRVRLVNPPDQERAILRAGGRAAERLETPKPLLAVLRKKLDGKPRPVEGAKTPPKPVAPVPARPLVAPAPMVAKPVAPPLPARSGTYVVQVAAFSSRDRAEAVARRIGAKAVQSGNLWRVRYGPYPSEAAARAGMDQAASKGFRDARIMANDP